MAQTIPPFKPLYLKQNIYRYKVEQFGLVNSKEVFGLSLRFDSVVGQTISDWQITHATLLTRFGGIIGVGKELLWVILLTFTSITFVRRCFKIKD